MTETTGAQRWVTRGRNLVLALGVLYAYSLISVILHLVVAPFVANRIASNIEGEFPWVAFLQQRLPLEMASVLASAITGLVAALYLRFSRAWLVVLALASLLAMADYRSHVWYSSPAAWEHWLQVSTSVAVGLAMPLAFLVCYRRAGSDWLA